MKLVMFKSSSMDTRKGIDYVECDGIKFEVLKESDDIVELLYKMVRVVEQRFDSFRSCDFCCCNDVQERHKLLKEYIKGIKKYSYMNDISNTVKNVLIPLYVNFDFWKRYPHLDISGERYKAELLFGIVVDENTQLSGAQIDVYFDEYYTDILEMIENTTSNNNVKFYGKLNKCSWNTRNGELGVRGRDPKRKKNGWKLSERTEDNDYFTNKPFWSKPISKNYKSLVRDTSYYVEYDFIEKCMTIDEYGWYEDEFLISCGEWVHIPKTDFKSHCYRNCYIPEVNYCWKDIDKKRKQWDKPSKAHRGKSMKRPYYYETTWELEKKRKRAEKKARKAGDFKSWSDDE